MDTKYKDNKGVSLILALLLLLVLTIIGVAGMSSISMQERMAANSNLQSLAFEAASAGVADVLEWGLNIDVSKPTPTEWGTYPDGSPRECSNGSLDELATRDGVKWIQDVGPKDYTAIEGGRTRFSVQIGCFTESSDTAGGLSDEDLPVQVLALSKGEVLVNEEVVSSRSIEVRLEPRGGEMDCLINIGPLDKDSKDGIVGPNANTPGGGIDAGPGGCPVRVADEASAAALKEELREQTLDRWNPPPGVVHGNLADLWESPKALASAANSLKIGIRSYNEWTTRKRNYETWRNSQPDPGALPPNPFLSVEEDLGIDPADPDTSLFEACKGVLVGADPEVPFGADPGTPLPSCPDNPDLHGIYYWAKDLDPGGSGCSYQGTVLIEGRLGFNGQDTFQSDLIVLGGELRVDGFGTTDNRGLMTLVNLVEPQHNLAARPAYEITDSLHMGESKFDIRGMGNALIETDDCDVVKERRARLNACLDAMRGGGRAPEDGLDERLGSKRMLEPLDDPTVYDGELYGFGPVDPTNPPNHFQFFSYLINIYGPALDGDNPFPAEFTADGPFWEELYFDESAVETDVPIRFPIPRCDGNLLGAKSGIASWREYIDPARWE